MTVVAKARYLFVEDRTTFVGCGRCSAPKEFCRATAFQELCRNGSAGRFLAEGARFSLEDGMLDRVRHSYAVKGVGGG
jgi:hypothetical protein